MGRPHSALVEIAAGRSLPPVEEDRLLLESALEHRMTGLLFSSARRSGSPACASAFAELARWDLATRARQRCLWMALSRIRTRLSEGGFEIGTMKGVTTEARWYDRHGERPCRDLDLLVAPTDLARIDQIVVLLDPVHPLLPTVRDLVVAGHLQSIDVEIEHGLWVDLHVDLFKLGPPMLHPDLVWDRTLPFQLPDGGVVRVPGAEIALAHLLVHLTKDRFSYLLGLADVARVLAREDLDWAFFDRFIRLEGLEAPVYLALERVSEALGLPARHRPPTRGWRAACWRALWPERAMLRGDAGVVRHTRLHFCLPFLARGRRRAAWRWWARRIVPPAALVDLWWGRTRSPFLWRLVLGRLGRAAGWGRHRRKPRSR